MVFTSMIWQELSFDDVESTCMAGLACDGCLVLLSQAWSSGSRC